MEACWAMQATTLILNVDEGVGDGDDDDDGNDVGDMDAEQPAVSALTLCPTSKDRK